MDKPIVNRLIHLLDNTPSINTIDITGIVGSKEHSNSKVELQNSIPILNS